MNEQLELGEYARNAGMAVAWDNASERWKADARAAIEQLAQRGQPFTAEDVRELAGDPLPNHHAMGAALGNARREGLIKTIGYVKAKRRSLHAAEIKLWIRDDSHEAAS